MEYEAIVVGVSLGGLQVLNQMLPAISKDFSLPIVIVQHRALSSDDYLARTLNEKCPLTVKEVDDKETIEAGTVYLAPANYHLLIEDDRTFALSVIEPVHYARPSIDVLFETAAEVFGAHLIGIILTGASADGSRGLKYIQEKGGLTIVQEPATAQATIMPQAAIERVHTVDRPVDYILPLEEIVPFFMKIVNRPMNPEP